jgi:tetratricopeptide (TPR) repeat protein
MFSEDYVLRIIRQAISVFAKIFGLKSAGQYQEAIQVIDRTLEQLLGMDAEIIDMMDDENLYILLTKNDVLDLEELEFIADLFKEKGDIQKQKNRINESVNCYVRSLNYYLVISINVEPSGLNKLSQKIADLLQKLASFDFEEQTLLNLYSYYEKVKEYAKAEAILNQLASRDQSKAYISDEIKSFYQRLLEKSEKELADGGVNRAQIQNKLHELESQKK